MTSELRCEITATRPSSVARVLTAIIGLVLTASQSQAEFITWEFSGVVDSVIDPLDYLEGAVHTGDQFVVSFTFDESAPDLLPLDPDLGRYEGLAAALVLPGLEYFANGEANVYSDGEVVLLGLGDNGSYFLSRFHGVPVAGDQLPASWLGSPGSLSFYTAVPHAKLFGTIIPEPNTPAMMLIGLLLISHRWLSQAGS